MEPTSEQQAAVDAFRTGDSVVLEAGAGTGKTTTLRLLAQASRHKGLYLAFNRSVAQDAKKSFGPCKAMTAHGLAFAHVGRKFQDRLNGPRILGDEAAACLGIDEPLKVAEDRAVLEPRQLVRLALDMVKRWAHTADAEVTAGHVPHLEGLDPDAQQKLGEYLLPYAQKAWAELEQPTGRLRFEHDYYLKMFALQRPDLGFDYLLYDEAQDANGVTAGLVADQQRRGAQLVVVGDRSQAIYGWRGATDAMDMFDVQHRLQLSQSFRFGEAIAAEANKWLTLLNANLRLTGTPTIASRVAPSDTADAVLCRTNAGALTQVISAHENAVPVAIVGGGNDIRYLADAADELQQRGRTSHPELCAFESWRQVQDYVDHDGGADLAAFVRLIDTHGPQPIKTAIDHTVGEHAARLVVSTAHKAKGREWPSVRAHTDFNEPLPDVPVAREEAMLAYVTVTRAQRHLDPEGLAWIDDHLADNRHGRNEPPPQPPATPPARTQAPVPSTVADSPHDVDGVDGAAGYEYAVGVPDVDGYRIVSRPDLSRVQAQLEVRRTPNAVVVCRAVGDWRTARRGDPDLHESATKDGY